MLPVLFSIGKFSVSSFGFFLIIGLLYGFFLIWRLVRAWDLDEEKALDLMLLTFIAGLLGARLYFVSEHLSYFTNSPLNIFLVNKAPGFNFWGGLLGGWLCLYFSSRKLRFDFWQLADIASVGLLGGLIFSNLGCFLGACQAGAPSQMFLAVTQEGLVGKRWPVQLLEAGLFIYMLRTIWSVATHFHQSGKIVGLNFIYIGIISLILEPIKADHSGAVFSLSLTLLGLTVYYKITKKNPFVQFKNLLNFLGLILTQPKTRKAVVVTIAKACYNQKTNFIWKIQNIKKSFRRSHVKLS